MADADGMAERLERLRARLEAVVAARDAEIAALRTRLDVLTSDRADLVASAQAADMVRQEELALRTEAADALDRAIAELRAMADARDAQQE